MRRTWLVVPIVLSCGSICAAQSDVPRFQLPDQRVKIAQPIEVGELRNALELDLTVASVVEVRNQRAHLDVILAEPMLYTKLLEAFTSTDPSGCSRVYPEAGVEAAFTAELCRLQDFAVAFDPRTRAAELRAGARMRMSAGGVTQPASNRAIQLRAEIAFERGAVVFRPASLTIEGVPSEASAFLLGQLGDFSIFLHRCLKNGQVELEDVQLEKGSNRVRIRALAPIADSVGIMACFGLDSIQGLGVRIP